MAPNALETSEEEKENAAHWFLNLFLSTYDENFKQFKPMAVDYPIREEYQDLIGYAVNNLTRKRVEKVKKKIEEEEEEEYDLIGVDPGYESTRDEIKDYAIYLAVKYWDSDIWTSFGEMDFYGARVEELLFETNFFENTLNEREERKQKKEAVLVAAAATILFFLFTIYFEHL